MARTEIKICVAGRACGDWQQPVATMEKYWGQQQSIGIHMERVDVMDDRNHACTHGAKAKPEGSDEVRNCRCKSREHNAETSHA